MMFNLNAKQSLVTKTKMKNGDVTMVIFRYNNALLFPVSSSVYAA